MHVHGKTSVVSAGRSHSNPQDLAVIHCLDALCDVYPAYLAIIRLHLELFGTEDAAPLVFGREREQPGDLRSEVQALFDRLCRYLSINILPAINGTVNGASAQNKKRQ